MYTYMHGCIADAAHHTTLCNTTSAHMESAIVELPGAKRMTQFGHELTEKLQVFVLQGWKADSALHKQNGVKWMAYSDSATSKTPIYIFSGLILM